MKNLHYFGTDTRACGHYFWDSPSHGNTIMSSDISFRDIPFNPEDYPPMISKYDSSPKGTVHYDVVKGWSIFAISGSPIDKRGGCKSVFFIKEALTQGELIEMIKEIPAAMNIINKMPFEINHKDFIKTT